MLFPEVIAENWLIQQVKRTLLVFAQLPGSTLEPSTSGTHPPSAGEFSPEECSEEGEIGNLKVIGAGLGKTGTASLQAALDLLGYRTYHMVECLVNQHFDVWGPAIQNASAVAAAASEVVGSGYDATVDDPASERVLELIELYPDAKVILTTRSGANGAEKWYKSVLHIEMLVRALSRPPWTFVPAIRGLVGIAKLIHRDRRSCLFLDEDLKNGDIGRSKRSKRESCIAYYEDHNEKIRSMVPPDRLLEYQMGEGWEPLCSFLGKPVPTPDVLFPHVNDGRSSIVARQFFEATTAAYYAVMTVLVIYVGRKASRFLPSRRESVRSKTNTECTAEKLDSGSSHHGAPSMRRVSVLSSMSSWDERSID